MGKVIRRVVVAAALVAVWPALVMISSYRGLLAVEARLPALELQWDEMLQALRGRSIECGAPSGRVDRIPAEEFGRRFVGLASADHSVGMAAYSFDDWLIAQAMRWGAPGTTGLRTLKSASLAFYDAASDVRHGAVCPDWMPIEEEAIRLEDPRSQAVIDAFRASLETLTPRMVAAREALERDRPVLAVTAWSLGILEVVGWTLLLVSLPGDVRALRARRAERAGGAT